MIPKTIDVDPDNVDPNGIVDAGSAAGAEALTLNGVLVTGGVATLDFGRRLNITSASNNSGITFTFAGTDPDGFAQSEVLTGPNISTVETTKYFKTVASITTSGATVGTVDIGTVDEVITKTIPLDWRNQNGVTIAVDVLAGSTIDFTVEEAFELFNRNPASPHQNIAWFPITALTAQTADIVAAASRGATALRFKTNSYTDTAEAQIYLSQANY